MPNKNTIIILMLILWSTFANSCPNKNFIDNAGDAFKPLFLNPPDLSRSSMMPFIGKVLHSDCKTEFASCRVYFGVEEVFFNSSSIIEKLTGGIETPVTMIAVTIDNISNPEFSKNSKWLIIAESYSERDGEGGGFIKDASCDLSIAKYENGNFVVRNGALKIPYHKVRDEVMRPVTPEGINRLKTAFSELLLRLKSQ